MAEYNAFLKIVKEKYSSKIGKRPRCPYCNSSHVKSEGQSTTLVAGKYNHLWEACECLNCHKKFTLETKEQGMFKRPIRWITSPEKRILKGIPACFENYIYTCNKCGGEVHRKHLELNSDNEVGCLSSGKDVNGVWVNHYRTVFICKDCGVKIESENDHYIPKPPKQMSYEEKVKEAKERQNLRLGWVIYEEVGVCVINNYAINKVSVNKDDIKIDKR